MMTQGVTDVILWVGSISGLISLIYVVFQNLRKRPRFKLDFHGMKGEHIDKDGTHFYRFFYTGILKNQSLDPNAVTRLHLAVWGNKKKTSALRFGSAPATINDKSKQVEIKLPMAFSPREAKHLDIVFEFPVKGTIDETILLQQVEIWPGSGFYSPRYEYEICIEDVGENLFDSQGRQLNREETDLRWALPNTMHAFQQGRVWPFLSHWWRIAKSRMKFRSKVLMQAFGLWR